MTIEKQTPQPIRFLAVLNEFGRVTARYKPLPYTPTPDHLHLFRFKVKVSDLGLVRTRGKSQWLHFAATIQICSIFGTVEKQEVYRINSKSMKRLYRINFDRVDVEM